MTLFKYNYIFTSTSLGLQLQCISLSSFHKIGACLMILKHLETFFKLCFIFTFGTTKLQNNRISGIIVSVLPLSVVDCGFEPCSDETKEYTIAICCFSAKHAPLRNKSQDWLA
jgi:hypothetical protein